MTGKETTLAAKTQSKKAKKTPAPMVRYSPAVRDAICERLIADESLRAICASTEMPAMKIAFAAIGFGGAKHGRKVSEAVRALRHRGLQPARP